ncbi:hypothetical protein FHR32_005057 [Streptosporangium album]|uniref:Uncharacterized protein n=1 Tax=Streptosporangium album TaxID=47479 RepID=A0A7W7WBU9_9ACTN|nr:hypothetical protein [Streptosporangium album]
MRREDVRPAAGAVAPLILPPAGNSSRRTGNRRAPGGGVSATWRYLYRTKRAIWQSAGGEEDGALLKKLPADTDGIRARRKVGG